MRVSPDQKLFHGVFADFIELQEFVERNKDHIDIINIVRIPTSQYSSSKVEIFYIGNKE